MATSAMATPFSGSIWQTGTLTQANAATALLPGSSTLTTPALATFTVNAINFDSRRGTTTYDTFLKGDPILNPNGLVSTHTPPYGIQHR